MHDTTAAALHYIMSLSDCMHSGHRRITPLRFIPTPPHEITTRSTTCSAPLRYITALHHWSTPLPHSTESLRVHCSVHCIMAPLHRGTTTSLYRSTTSLVHSTTCSAPLRCITPLHYCHLITPLHRFPTTLLHRITACTATAPLHHFTASLHPLQHSTSLPN